MSAYINPPKGHVFIVFEIHEDEGMRFLACVPSSHRRRKVIVKAKVQPIRKTKGAHRLVIYCVPGSATAEVVRKFVDSLIAVFNGIADRIKTDMHPLVGMPINDATREEAARILVSIPQAIPRIHIEVTI